MNPTCMIVDDHKDLRNLLCNWLKITFPNVEFTDAETGETACDLAMLIKPEVVIMDIGLPGINGIEATRRIKSALPETFIIIHTIHEEQAYREDAALAGVDGYITKSRTQIDLVTTLFKVFSNLKTSEPIC